MSSFDLTRMVIALVLIFGLFCFCFIKLFGKKTNISTKFIVRTGIFAAISIILYTVPYLKFPVFFFPSFLELHFDEVPAFIAGFAYGPWSAVAIIFIKTIIKLPLSTSMCVGELADLLYSLVFVIPACIIYRKRKNIKSALAGLGISTILQVVVASLFTSFVILNFYMAVMGLSEETIINMCKAVNPNVTSLGWTFCFLVALPFNLFKDVIVVIITFILYKRLHRLIDRI